ncbi:hypothetical protein [Consotaella aegiceratis]|uniref:hypothetical protein n=1 Tax=Consotaella aegiceratis TaxID=3097961 RepID=UPI002F408C0A
MLSFPWIKRALQLRGFDEGHKTLTMNRDGFLALLDQVIRASPFDEDFYLSAYPDVAAAVEQGEIETGFEHYKRFGFYEGRFPGFRGFDPDAYVAANPDLASFKGRLDYEKALREHYHHYGFVEGRPLRPQRVRSLAR